MLDQFTISHRAGIVNRLQNWVSNVKTTEGTRNSTQSRINRPYSERRQYVSNGDITRERFHAGSSVALDRDA
jgi:hypothetical protein